MIGKVLQHELVGLHSEQEVVRMAPAQCRAGTSGEELARFVLEYVCSGADPAAAEGVYSPDFLDHVNARDYRGHEGIAKSLARYQLAFRDGDLRVRVEQQVTEGDRVCSRWIAEGHNRGRPLRLI
jgi:SnoaL-like polyketide cyclase